MEQRCIHQRWGTGSLSQIRSPFFSPSIFISSNGGKIEFFFRIFWWLVIIRTHCFLASFFFFSRDRLYMSGGYRYIRRKEKVGKGKNKNKELECLAAALTFLLFVFSSPQPFLFFPCQASSFFFSFPVSLCSAHLYDDYGASRLSSFMVLLFLLPSTFKLLLVLCHCGLFLRKLFLLF
jgi:hypothetical protein